MAKKGPTQLQADLQTDDDLYKFIDRPGLILCDIYSEWCGPCLSMVSALKKIKLELAGDDLQLAICKSDTIDVLARFRNKSEATWMFIIRRKVVNLQHGSDVPKLMKVIQTELKIMNNTRRPSYEIWQLLPEEQIIHDLREQAEAEALRKKIEEAERAKLEFLTQITDDIISNLPDMGVMMFGPHVHRDTIKKVFELAEKNKIQCKDRRTQQLQPEQFDIINFACQNPIPPEVLEHMYRKDLLLTYWKIAAYQDKKFEDVFLSFVRDLTTPKEDPTLPGFDEPALLVPLEIKIKDETRPHKEEEVKIEIELPQINLIDGEIPAEEEAEEAVPEPAESVASDVQIILVPPVWVPSDRRTHATLIYVFFRNQTATFIPPDPVPEPPHIVMAFEAKRRREIYDVIEKHKQHILALGFFSNDDPDKATLLAETYEKYEKRSPPLPTDKLVLKVTKVTSHTMLSFASFNPTLVSQNPDIGKVDALKFFPEHYNEPPPES